MDRGETDEILRRADALEAEAARLRVQRREAAAGRPEPRGPLPRALDDAQARLRRAQEAGGVGLFTVDIADDLTIPTPEFCRLYGVPVRERCSPRVFEERVIPEDAALVSWGARARGEPVRDVEAGPGRAAVAFAQGGETVLVVDDEPTVRLLVTDVLEDLGYTAIEAADSADGLRVLRSQARIDLLVTDVGLPGGVNGRRMADAARAGRPDLKVLSASAT